MADHDTMFGHAVRAASSVGLDVTGPRLDGEGTPLSRPYAILGRSDDASVVLPDKTVSLRHCLVLQYCGRLFIADLLSANGTRLNGQKLQSGWWPPESVLSIGPYELAHSFEADGEPPPSPMDFRPRNDSNPFYGNMPEVSIELLDRKNAKGQSWPINRVLTFLGRDDRCRITCGDDSVSLVHCAFVMTPAGLWVVDLLSRNGVRINNQRVSCGLLSDGFELAIGRYKMRAHVHKIDRLANSGITDLVKNPNVEFLTKNHKVFTVAVIDEVVVVTPRGDLQDFLYQEFQMESNAVIHAITAGKYRHVVVDFSAVRLVGSIVIEAVAGFCRSAKGKAAFCCASVEMYEALDHTRLPSIWYHYATKEDAIAAVKFDDQAK